MQIKRVLLWIMIGILCLGISACKTATPTPLPPTEVAEVEAPAEAESEVPLVTDVFTVYGGEIAQFAQEYEQQKPVSLSFELTTVAGPTKVEISDATEIRAIFDALRALQVTNEPGVFVTDNGAVYTFKTEAGKEIAIRFNGASVEVPAVEPAGENQLFVVQGFEKLNEVTAPLMEKLQTP